MKRRAKDDTWRYLGVYRDPSGRKRSAGSFATHRDALRAATRAEVKIGDGRWIDRQAGRITFETYVETVWWPSLHLEISTKAAYRSNLDRHFVPFFGDYPLSAILPSLVQTWVTAALEGGLSPRSVVKYHVVLHGIFARAVRDRLIAHNPCADTDLPKVVTTQQRIITPEQFEQLLAAVPDRYRTLVLTAIETGMRWGELAALRPRHLDLTTGVVRVQETIVEVSKKDSPTGQRMIIKAYPKDNEPRALRISTTLTEALQQRIHDLGLTSDDLMFGSTRAGGHTPMSRNTFRTRVWVPATRQAGLEGIRVHDLRHAHASWLLAGGADLKTVMDRLGHTQIQTTQKYLHTLPDADDKALAAFQRTRSGHRSE
jgi:integrase